MGTNSKSVGTNSKSATGSPLKAEGGGWSSGRRPAVVIVQRMRQHSHAMNSTPNEAPPLCWGFLYGRRPPSLLLPYLSQPLNGNSQSSVALVKPTPRLLLTFSPAFGFRSWAEGDFARRSGFDPLKITR